MKFLFRTSSVVIVFIAVLSLTGCKSRISESKFVNYYIDFVVMQDSLGRDKGSTDKIIDALDKKYGVTRKEYEATIDYYSADTERWELFFNKVIKEAQKREMESPKKP